MRLVLPSIVTNQLECSMSTQQGEEEDEVSNQSD